MDSRNRRLGHSRDVESVTFGQVRVSRVVSGYSGPILTQDALAAGVSELLTKPLQSRDLATTLARALHSAG